MAQSQSVPFVRDRFTVLAYGMLAYFSFFMTALGPLMPFLRDELHMSYSLGALHLSAFSGSSLIMNLIGDRIVAWLGRRPVFWGAATGMAIGALLLTLARSPVLTIASCLFMGVNAALLLLLVQATLADRHGERRAIALTEANVYASLSAACAPLAIGSFQAWGIGWRSALWLVIGAFGLMALVFMRTPVPGAPAADEETPGRRSTSLPPLFWLYAGVIFFGVAIEWCFSFWAADYLADVIGVRRVVAATTVSLFLGAMLIGRIVGSVLSRRYATVTLLWGALLLTGIGFPLFWLSRVVALNMIGLFVAGLGVANLYPLTMAAALGVAPHRSNVASARIGFSSASAILSVPLLLGWLADQIALQRAFGVIIVLVALSMVFLFAAGRCASRTQLVAQSPS